MLCHECAMAGGREPAVGLCRFCLIGLCKPHLVELFRRAPSAPQYTCRHRPNDAVATRERAVTGIV